MCSIAVSEKNQSGVFFNFSLLCLEIIQLSLMKSKAQNRKEKPSNTGSLNYVFGLLFLLAVYFLFITLCIWDLERNLFCTHF